MRISRPNFLPKKIYTLEEKKALDKRDGHHWAVTEELQTADELLTVIKGSLFNSLAAYCDFLIGLEESDECVVVLKNNDLKASDAVFEIKSAKSGKVLHFDESEKKLFTKLFGCVFLDDHRIYIDIYRFITSNAFYV